MTQSTSQFSSPARLASLPLLLLLLIPASRAAAIPPPEPPARIPEVHTANFSGTPIDLPAMLEGKVAILVLGFSKGSRTQATLWGRRLATDYLYATDVLYYEMPVLASVPRMLRPVVLRSIRAEVSERSQPHFAPLTTDEARWRSVVHFGNPDSSYVLIVNSKGLVEARFEGEPTDATYQDLKRRIEQLRARPSN